jgi:two-component system chemotaxis response regulator CheY
MFLLRVSQSQESLPDLLLQQLQALAQLQNRAESLSAELAALKEQLAQEARDFCPSCSLSAELVGDESILVANDHDIVRVIAYEILSSFGYHVTLAEADLTELAPAGSIDLILLDIAMLDDEQLTRIKRVRQAAPAVRLVVSTPLPEGPARDRLREAGVHGFVSKPFQPLALALCVRHVLDAQ